MSSTIALARNRIRSRPRRAHCQDDRPPFRAPTPDHLALGRAIAEARDFDELREAGRSLRARVVALHEARPSAAAASAALAEHADALTRRSIELAITELGPPPCAPTWIALGSHGRREPMPGSDMDSALAWVDEEEREEVTGYMRALGARVCRGLQGCGFAADRRGASAAQGLFTRPLGSWRRLIRGSIEDPRSDKGLIVISLLLDGRIVYGGGGASELLLELGAAGGRRGLLRLMLGLALNNRPALRFLHEFALERSGEHRGRLDIKRGGLLPVTSIARYAGLAAGAIAAGQTAERLDAAAAAGALDGDFAATLREAFEESQDVRLEHQVRQIEGGIEPDDYVDPKALGATRRRRLRDALRAVRAVQRALGCRLSAELAFA
jgi:CBS domain-containing protein